METSVLAPTRVRKQAQSKSHAMWTQEEDALLSKLVSESDGSPSWSMLSEFFPNKTAAQLSGRWEKVINPKLIKGSWTTEEDETIIRFVKENGQKDWAKLALLLQGRTGKQCRERFRNHLNTNVNHEPWTEEEDALLVELHAKFGNAWTKLAEHFNGRSDNCIKNRWNSTVRKRLERLELGQPLVMKRGRKPKAPVRVESSCSSPVEEQAQKGFTSIVVIPLAPNRTEPLPELKLPTLPSCLSNYFARVPAQ